MSEPTPLHDRLHSRRVAPPPDDPDACDECGAYACLRGPKERAVMLDVRLRSGNREAFAYALLERVSFDPSAGLTLQFLGVTVVLTGRNLDRAGGSGVSLLEGVHRHRVPWVAEGDELQAGTQPAAATVVTRITIRLNT